jgi:hypothetical protein
VEVDPALFAGSPALRGTGPSASTCRARRRPTGRGRAADAFRPAACRSGRRRPVPPSSSRCSRSSRSAAARCSGSGRSSPARDQLVVAREQVPVMPRACDGLRTIPKTRRPGSRPPRPVRPCRAGRPALGFLAALRPRRRAVRRLAGADELDWSGQLSPIRRVDTQQQAASRRTGATSIKARVVPPWIHCRAGWCGGVRGTCAPGTACRLSRGAGAWGP